MATFSSKQVPFLLLTLFLLTASTQLQAQKLFFVYAHGLYANPADKNFKTGYHTGLGVEGGAAIGWNKTFVVGTIGCTSFFNKDNNTTGKTTFVPFKVGLRQYIFSKFVYLHGDVGVGKIKNNLYDDSRFSGDIGAGIKLAGFELQLDYDGFARKSPEPSGYASWIAVKAGFNMGL
ncbi:MAG: hypothetical protein ABI861_13700 [Panacibacter sp.]